MSWTYIYGRTSTPCYCCAPPGPECALECEMTVESGCALDGGCNPISYPYTIAECLETQNVDEPCPCFSPPATKVITGQVRLVLTGLEIGKTYTATVYFTLSGDPIPTDSYAWTFTASATTETTSWTSIPDPAGSGDPGWSATACDVVEVP